MDRAHHSHSNESCPMCHAPYTQRRHNAQRWVGVLGTAAGAVVGGFSGASKASPDWPAPLRLTFTLTSACLGAFASASTGCQAGTRLGKILDDSVIAQWVCQDCGFVFGGPVQAPPSDTDAQPLWDE